MTFCKASRVHGQDHSNDAAKKYLNQILIHLLNALWDGNCVPRAWVSLPGLRNIVGLHSLIFQCSANIPCWFWTGDIWDHRRYEAACFNYCKLIKCKKLGSTS